MSQTNTINLDECWLYAGFKNNYGYGRIFFRLNGGRVHTGAHRVMYENMVGKIPEGLVIDHLCRITACVNPEHLEPVTDAENKRRGVGISVVNSLKTHCAAGHEYDETNTYLDKANKRVCRKCECERVKLYYRLRKGKIKV